MNRLLITVQTAGDKALVSAVSAAGGVTIVAGAAAAAGQRAQAGLLTRYIIVFVLLISVFFSGNCSLS